MLDAPITFKEQDTEVPTDLGIKMEKITGVIKGRFYVITSLSDSWETFTPPHTGVTLGRFLH